MICFYHSADLDGHCSGAIVALAAELDNEAMELHGINYGDNFPWDIVRNRTVVMVDFSLGRSEMIELWGMTKRLIWIDHHKSAIESMKEFSIPGIRAIGRAGCELAWEYFFKDKEMPITVSLLGRYDVWDHSDKRILPFQYGMRLYDTRPDDMLSTWKGWFEEFPEEILKEGATVLKYEKQQDEKSMRAISFETEFQGKRCICANKLLGNSKVFESVLNEDKHDMMILFGWKSGKWSVSLYTHRQDLDVSVIAKKFGGGGHKQAAGFQCVNLPFDLR